MLLAKHILEAFLGSTIFHHRVCRWTRRLLFLHLRECGFDSTASERKLVYIREKYFKGTVASLSSQEAPPLFSTQEARNKELNPEGNRIQ